MKPLSVACPVCKAGKGRRCKGTKGNEPYVGDAHTARYKAARNALKSETHTAKLSDGTPVNVTTYNSKEK